MTLPRRPRDPEARVDIMFRCGDVRRNTPARWWRFGPSEAVTDWDFDIVRCQPSGAAAADKKAKTARTASGSYE